MAELLGVRSDIDHRRGDRQAVRLAVRDPRARPSGRWRDGPGDRLPIRGPPRPPGRPRRSGDAPRRLGWLAIGTSTTGAATTRSPASPRAVGPLRWDVTVGGDQHLPRRGPALIVVNAAASRWRRGSWRSPCQRAHRPPGPLRRPAATAHRSGRSPGASAGCSPVPTRSPARCAPGDRGRRRHRARCDARARRADRPPPGRRRRRGRRPGVPRRGHDVAARRAAPGSRSAGRRPSAPPARSARRTRARRPASRDRITSCSTSWATPGPGRRSTGCRQRSVGRH